ncbi:MAG: hypothetical protein ACWGOV_11940 [Acidiferrobacterales bacterium]
MDNPGPLDPVPRKLEKFVGIVLVLIAILFFALTLYFSFAIFVPGKINWPATIFELILVLLGFSLGRWGIRLFRGKGANGTRYLMSRQATYLWSATFAIAGFLIAYFAFVLDRPFLLVLAIWCVMAGINGYRLYRKMKHAQEMK